MNSTLGLDERDKEQGDWPPLDRDEVCAVLARFHLAPASQPLRWQSKRPFSSTGKICLANGRSLFLKRHDQRLRSPTALQEEHLFITHLASYGLPVASPLRTPEGVSTISYRHGVFELFPELQGKDDYQNIPSWEPYRDVNHAHSAGIMMARLHHASQEYAAPPRQGRLLISSLSPLMAPNLADSLSQWVRTQEGLTAILPASWQDDLFPLILPFHRQLQELRSYLTPLWGHGDWHGSNMTWDHHEIKGIFDFSMSDQTSAEFDLAVALERSFIRWINPTHRPRIAFHQLEAFLEGYRRHTSRHPARLALIASLLPLCHVTFALSELAYYGHLLHNPQGVQAAYHGYLLGHARWFHSTEGRRLLHGIAPYA